MHFTLGKTVSVLIAWLVILPGTAAAADSTIVHTSFESTGTPSFPAGTINGLNSWSVAGGSGSVVADPSYAHTGSQALKITSSGVVLDIRHTPYGGSVPGMTGILYFDMYIKLLSSSTKEFSVVGYDLFSSSTKRTFIAEFILPANDTAVTQIRGYNGSTKVAVGNYTMRQWVRLSGKVDYAKGTYQIALNDTVISDPLAFRESYTPTASGTRQAGVKEYHQLRFNLGGGSSSGSSGSVDGSVDDIYVGTVAPEGINFGTIIPMYSLTVNQPSVGSIAVAPSGTSFPESTFVTATLSLPSGYKNLGWNGDLNGTDTMKQFYLLKNTTIGASVGIDSSNPPPLYTITVTQPDTGSILLNPSGPSFYAFSNVTATLTVPSGFKNVGWTGDLTGTQLFKSFAVLADMTIGADVVKDTVISGSGSRKTFTTAASFKTGIANAVPGDTIELINGTFDIGGITIIKTAANQSPILIRAQQRGKAELTGNSGFTLRESAFIIIEGFLFTGNGGTVIKGENSNYCRITRNIFRLNESTSGKWILIGGIYSTGDLHSYYNRVDHNLFDEKHQLGNYVTIDGTPDAYPPALSSQHDRIDHNYFKNIGPRAVNEMETIRLGQSSLSFSSGYTIVEFNLFEQCDGDPEIVSVKTNDNIIRYNTFRRSQGTASLRQGNNSELYGNFFLGEGRDSTGGVRVYGSGHKIFNNYFEGLTGDTWDAALAMTNGDVDTNSTSASAHHRPNRITIAFNTYVNNIHNMQFGFTNNGNYGKAPVNITIANNLVVGSQNELVQVFTTPTSISYTGNIMFPHGTATLGITAATQQINVTDPHLLFSDSLWRPGAGSPAVNAASGIFDFVLNDVEGKSRDVLKDVGAVELNASSRYNRPLSPADVGPDGPDSIVVTPVVDIVHAVTVHAPAKFSVSQNFPNPFNPTTDILFDLPLLGTVSLKIYDALGREIAALVDETLPAGSYSVRWDATKVSSGVYYYRLSTNDGVETKRMLLIK